MSPSPEPTRSHEWDSLRDVITALYLDDDKTVDEVKRYMEEHHGFFASCVTPRSEMYARLLIMLQDHDVQEKAGHMERL